MLAGVECLAREKSIEGSWFGLFVGVEFPLFGKEGRRLGLSCAGDQFWGLF